MRHDGRQAARYFDGDDDHDAARQAPSSPMPPASPAARGFAARWRARLTAGLLALAAGLMGFGNAAFAADPQIASFNDTPDPVPAGGLVTYTARIDNSAIDAATGVVVTVPVPAGATFVSATAPCALAGASVVCALGTVGPNGGDVRSLDVVLRANGPGPAVLSLQASLTAANDANPDNNLQTQTTTVEQGANLTLAKTGTPDPVIGGATVTYTLTAGNLGPNVSQDIVVTDTLPPAVTYVSGGGSGWSCVNAGAGAGSTVTCTHAGTHAVGTAIAPPLTITGTVAASGGSITNVASIAPAAGGTADPDASNNTATTTTGVVPGADVSIAQKSVTSGLPATAGSNVTFVIQARNGGPAPAANPSVTDTLPAGWTVVSATGPNWTCTVAGRTASCTRASLPAGATDDVTIVATAPPNAAIGTGTTYTNTATIVSPTTPDPVSTNNTGTVSVPVRASGADLRLTKVKSPNPVAQGQTMTSVVRVLNDGPRTATGPLRVVEQLSANEVYVSALGTGWLCIPTPIGGSTIVCDHANTGGLAYGAGLPALTITTRALAAGTLTNTACTSGSLPAGATAGVVARPPVEGDPIASNDCASVGASSTTIRPDLSIRKTTTSPAGKTVGPTDAAVTYTLVVTNVTAAPGTDAATGIVIEDTVPATIAGGTNITATATASAGSTATFGCAVAAAKVTCTQTGGALAPGQTVTVPITVARPMTAGSFTNTATVRNTVEGDPVTSNNTSSDTVTVVALADVEVTGKTVTPQPVLAGQTATYVLSFRNNGPSPAAAVTLTDAFSFAAGDTGMTVLSVVSTATGSSCNVAAGSVLTPAAPTVTCQIGTLASGETQTVTLAVRPNFQAGGASRTVGNVATLATATAESTTANNARSATLTVNPASADLLTNKTDLEDPVLYTSNAFFNYRVRVSSIGPSYATGVRINETMTPPAGKRIRFVCDTVAASSATCNPTPLCSGIGATSAPGTALAFTCSVPAGTAATGPGVGELAATQSKDVFLRFEAIDQPAANGDIYNNVVRVVANEPDAFPANDASSEPTTVRQRIDLSVAKTSSVAAPGLRQPFVWTVTVRNAGPGNALQTNAGDTLPAGVTVTGPATFAKTSPAANGTCTVTGSAVACAMGLLNGGGTATISIPVRIDAFPAGGTLTNTGAVNVDPALIGGIDPDPSNDTATHTVTVTRASLTGTVFQDRDRAGANAGTPQDPSVEPRIAGVSVRLTGTDAYGSPVDLTATTDAAGVYAFPNLPASDAAGYTVTETQPAGFGQSPAAPPTSGALAPSAGGSYTAAGTGGASVYAGVVLGTGTAAVNYNFPELRQATLAGFVYLDLNANGVRDPATDAAVANATVRLLNAATSVVVATTATDAAGAYTFAGLDGGTLYTLEEPLPATPAGLLNGPVNPGLVNGAACASGCTAQPDTPAAGTDRIAAIDLSAGDGTGFNFGERAQAAIAGLVYVDADRNGALDPTDTVRLAGVTVRLVQGADCTSGTTLRSTATLADGSYLFGTLVAGQDYLVCETQPAGYGDGSATPGANGTAVGANAIRVAALPAGGSTGNLFGERGALVGGSVFLDANNDGQRAGDAGIAGVTVTLTGTDVAGAAVSRTAVTDAAGAWRFDGLSAPNAAGYTVTEQTAQPVVAGTATLNGRTTAGSAGGTATAVTTTPSAVSGIAVAAGGDATGYDFGEILPASLAGIVFTDADNDGVPTPPADAGLAGVTVVLTGTDDTGAAVSRTLTSAADGTFSAAGLRPGSYTLTEPTQPPGTVNGLTVAGSAGGTATAVATLPSAIAGIVLAPGAAAVNYRFAERASAGSIAGRVWLDADNSGSVNGSEAGIAGVTIELAGTDTGGAAVSRSAVTDADGRYRFADLPPGRYTVREPSQPSGTVNGATLAGTSGGTPTTPATTPSAVEGIVLGAAAAVTGVDFGEVPAASVAGRVFNDLNGNGRVDAGEGGLAGVAMVLSGRDDLGASVTVNAVTDADGRFAFAGLRPGTYAVTEPTQPPGTSNGLTTAGTVGGVTAGTATPPATLPSAVSGIVLAPGAASIDNLFAELGSSPDLLVTKAATEARFTVGHVGHYTVRVRNAGSAPTAGSYTVSDRLPAGLTLDAVPTGSGWSCTGAAGATSFTCTSSAVLAAGADNAGAVAVTVRVAAAALAASPVDNAVLVEGGGETDARAPTAAERAAFNGTVASLPLCATPAAANACRVSTPVQQAASVSGTAWYDVGSTLGVLDGGDRRLAGWGVEITDPATGAVLARATTGSDGTWRVADQLPGIPLAVRYRDPQTNTVWGYPVNGETAPGSSGAVCDQANAIANGGQSSCPGGAGNPSRTVVLAAGRDLPQQSLPLDPGGVVYDSGTRQPVPGAVVTLAPTGACTGWDPSTSIVGATLGGYTVNGAAVSTTVGREGFYQFLFAPGAPSSCTFGLTVTAPAGWRFVSTLIPPTAGTYTPSGAPGSASPVQPQAAAPTGAVGPATAYYLALVAGSATATVVHNHLPLDADVTAGLSISKVGDRAVAEIGDTVRYTVTVQKTSGALPAQTTVVDRLPAGFTFVPGTAMVGGVPIADPAGAPGPVLTFNLGAMPASGQLVLQYRLRVGVGAQQGDGLNRARGHACGVPAGCVGPDGQTPVAGAVSSNESRFQVRVTGGVFTTEACVLGKVFVDCNGNHVQDREELGIPGVRLVLTDGTFLVSDSEGKYSYCGLPPRSAVLKVDGFTLPRGSRLTTTSNRNLGDAGSLWLDLKNGELHRADFAEGSCSNTVLEQVKARRAQGEVRTVEMERARGPALRFDSKAHGLDTLTSPQQGTDGANQRAPKPRDVNSAALVGPAGSEVNVPVPALPMNRPPPTGRTPADAADATVTGGSNAAR